MVHKVHKEYVYYYIHLYVIILIYDITGDPVLYVITTRSGNILIGVISFISIIYVLGILLSIMNEIVNILLINIISYVIQYISSGLYNILMAARP